MTGSRSARKVLIAVAVAAMLGAALIVAPPAAPAAVLLLFTIGIIAGIFGGLIGVGGSTIMLPIMYFYLGFPEPIAVGTGLFVVIFTSLSGAAGHLVRGNLDRRVAGWIAAGGLVGVIFGS